jgi:hypothetical protein
VKFSAVACHANLELAILGSHDRETIALKGLLKTTDEPFEKRGSGRPDEFAKNIAKKCSPNHFCQN